MTWTSRARPPHGFSTIELAVAMAITLTVTAAVFGLLNPSSGAFQAQPEAADIEQRLRAAVDSLERDIKAAGGGVRSGPLAGAMGRVAPAVLPYRAGRRSPDPPGSHTASRITVVTVAPGAAQSTLAAPLAAASGTAQLNVGPGCEPTDPSCGFRPNTTVLAYDGSGSADLYSVTGVMGGSLTLQHDWPDSPKVYPAASTPIAEATSRTYFLKEDPGSDLPQLTRYDGAGGGDVPVVSQVVALAFEYLGEAEAPVVVGGIDPALARTTYGPLPPPPTEQPTAYPPGENCAFLRMPDGSIAPRLPSLAAAPVLVRLSAADLTDGPWCPDDLSPSRYDADLLRVRVVTIRLRVQSAVAALRGPAGPLFTRGGTAPGTRMVPDRETTLVITPRPLNMVR